MIERHIVACGIEDPGLELPAASRERLKDHFPRGATRRMTQLGLLVGSVLSGFDAGESDSIVYATRFAENQALEEYLASFPTPSPTLFQTSIHPSAVQQVLIARQQPIREFFPLTGDTQLGAHAIQTALLAPSPRVILCGGEERGTWLREQGSASEETFAFAVALSTSAAGSIGSVKWIDGGADCPSTLADPGAQPAYRGRSAPPSINGSGLTLRELFDCLRDRRPLHRQLAIGATVEISWR
jgi:hypothetical protein